MKLALIAVILGVFLTSGVGSPPVRIGDPPPTEQDYRTEQALAQEPKPPRNLYELYPRLKGVDAADVGKTAGSTSGWQVGTVESFWVSNLSTRQYTQRQSTLRYISDGAYWFVENSRTHDPNALRDSAERFDQVARMNRATFGSEWSPGVDNDPRVVILIASTPGAGGYFSSADEYPRAINPYSNQHEMIYIDSTPGQPEFNSTLAHELQHMIHWNQHASQDVWINEGMSEYAAEMNDLPVGLPEASFAASPDTQLNAWSDSPGAAVEHYGQAYRFMSYLAARFGPDVMSRIIKAPGTGLDAVAVGLTAEGSELAAVYGDFLRANLFVEDRTSDDSDVRPMTPVSTEPLDASGAKSDTVAQWGADYYSLQTNDAFTLRFTATPTVRVVDNNPRSGSFQWYSNRGDLLNSTLTRDLDLSGVQAATLEVDMWYDIEEAFDYGYIEVSTDGGRRWTTLRSARTTDTNPNGNNLGNGYTGRSNGWVTERFDLSQYAGLKVMLRIEYVTDDGYNAPGLVVDGVRVPEIGLSDDSESGDNGWRAEGWVRTNNTLPAHYRLLLLDEDAPKGYREIPAGADGRAFAQLDRGSGSPPVIVVGGAAAVTTLPSEYRLELAPTESGGLGLIGGRAQPSPR